MNREIKFRAWDNLNKIMLSWDSFKNIKFDIGDGYETGIPLEILEEKYQKQHNLIPQQFTGLKDKNGVEIYEGDIIEFEYHNGGGFSKVKEEVIFNHGSFSVWQDPLSEYNVNCIKLGNIYENPELLTNKN